MDLISGVVVLAGANIRKELGFGWWLTCLAVLQFMVNDVIHDLIWRQMRAYKRAAVHLPPRLHSSASESSTTGLVSA